MRSLMRYLARPSAPPKPPTRTGTGCAAGVAVRPASDSVMSRSARPARRPANCRASAVPPRMRMRAMPDSKRSVSKTPRPEATGPDTAASPRWLSIVGIGEDGVEGLSPVARGLIGAAEIGFGGRRPLGLAAPLIRGATRPWQSPFDAAPDEVLHHRGRQICVLASGDPFHYGVGSALARRIDASEMTVIPAPSAFSLAAAPVGLALPDNPLT